VCGLDSTVSGQGPVEGYCECGDEPDGSCATEFVSYEDTLKHSATGPMKVPNTTPGVTQAASSDDDSMASLKLRLKQSASSPMNNSVLSRSPDSGMRSQLRLAEALGPDKSAT
jgi:hypothetical protein